MKTLRDMFVKIYLEVCRLNEGTGNEYTIVYADSASIDSCRIYRMLTAQHDLNKTVLPDTRYIGCQENDEDSSEIHMGFIPNQTIGEEGTMGMLFSKKDLVTPAYYAYDYLVTGEFPTNSLN